MSINKVLVYSQYCMVITYNRDWINQVRLLILGRGQLDRENEYFPVDVDVSVNVASYNSQ